MVFVVDLLTSMRTESSAIWQAWEDEFERKNGAGMPLTAQFHDF